MPASQAYAVDFSRASLSLQDLLLQLQREFSSWDISSSSLISWSDSWTRYRASVRKMPKAFRCHPLVKKSVCEMESFEREFQQFRAAVQEYSAREFQEWCERLNLKVRRAASLMAELEASPLVQKILRGEVLLSHKKILQWRRKLVHLTMGLSFFYLFVYSGWPTAVIWWIAGPFIGLSFLLETVRHLHPGVNRRVLRVFGSIMREGENKKINSAVFYIFSMAVVWFTFPIEVAMTTLLFIAVSDPLAGMVGTYWGRHRISPNVSWEGSAACFISCTALAALCAGRLFPHPLTGLALTSFSVLSGLIGALAEASLKRLDDNLVMPLISAPLLALLMRLFSIL